MPVQFQCPGCRNPIEIDDEWADQNVACPFCRKTVHAPTESTYSAPPVIPGAREIGSAETIPSAQPPAERNAVAVWALVCSCASIVTMFVVSAIFATNIMDVLGPDATPDQFQKYLMDQLQSGQPPGWIITVTFGVFGAMAMWIAGLICAVFSLRSRARRGLTYASLGVLSIGPLLMVFGR